MRRNKKGNFFGQKTNFKKNKQNRCKNRIEKQSINEMSISSLDPKLARWIRVIRPSRASLTYERYE